MFKCYDDIQCVNIPYVDIGEYKTYILNSVIALFKIIINTIILFIWWGITISILCSVGLCELSKYCEIGTGISDIIYRMTLKISTAILNFIHNIYPEHDCKATIIDRSSLPSILKVDENISTASSLESLLSPVKLFISTAHGDGHIL